MTDPALLALEVALEMNAPQEKRYKQVKTFRHDNPHLEHDPADKAPSRAMGNNTRLSGGGLTRFRSAAVTEPVPLRQAALDPRHPAVRDGTTIYPSRVFDASSRDRVLISGINNAKIGRVVTKGPWKGFPIFVLSLEERATCPRSCPVFSACYGNGLPMAVRFKYNLNLLEKLQEELAQHNANGGFVVRLHQLGDFVSSVYTMQWAMWLAQFPNLHVWGYTAHPPESAIGQAIQEMNANPRWKVRFSVAPTEAHAPMQAAAVWTKEAMNQDNALVCPQELGKTQACGTCALCWAEPMADTRILFLGHGSRGPKRKAT